MNTEFMEHLGLLIDRHCEAIAPREMIAALLANAVDILVCNRGEARAAAYFRDIAEALEVKALAACAPAGHA
jgi:hypothetical protein